MADIGINDVVRIIDQPTVNTRNRILEPLRGSRMNTSDHELDVDGFAFLDISLPHIAWAVYRGVLITPQREPIAGGRLVSLWLASQFLHRTHLARELDLETVRKQHFPDMVSRLVCMYCFLDKSCADQAVGWGPHFRPDNLAELCLKECTMNDHPLDANWISVGPCEAKRVDSDWMHRYWSGERYPEADPIWEALVEGKVTVLGTELRERAYEVVKAYWPDSLMLLEISRLGAWIGSNIGTINVFMAETTENYEFKFLLDMRDAKNPDFLGRIKRLMNSGHPVKWADIKPHHEQGEFGRSPDMTPFQFTCRRDSLKT